MASTSSKQLALHLLSAMKEQLHAGLTHEAVLNLCRAYALEPLLSTRHLVALPSHIVRRVVSTLEDWCASACGLASDDVLKRYHIPLTWEQVCDIILSPDVSPHSHQAWSLKIQHQMHEKRYAHTVATCTKALETFACGQGERHAYWIQRGLAYLFLKEFRNAVKDYLSAFDENPSACQAYVTKFQKGYIGPILNAFYNTMEKLDTETESAKPEDTPVFIKLHQFILTFEKNPGAYGNCASYMIKQHKFKEAIKFLSKAIRHFTGNSTTADYLQLLFSRAECYLALDQTDLALGDYVAAASMGEELTRLTLLSLPLHQQGALVARAKRVASDTLMQYQTNAPKDSAADTQPTKTTALDQAAGFFHLLYLIDEQYVDALYSAAQCRKLLSSFTEAIQLFSRFLSLRPKSCNAHYDRASCYLECGDMRSALRDYNTSLSLQPTFVQALCGRAWMWLRQGDPGKAVADFAAAGGISTELSARWIQELTGEEQAYVRAKLKDYLTCTVEATSATRFGDREGALGVADVLTRAWPTDVVSHLLYSDMLVSLKKTDEAQAVLVRLLQNTPDELTATAHLAALRMAQGRVACAVEDLVTAAKAHGEAKLQTALLSVKEEQRTQITREAHEEGVKRANANADDPDAEVLFTVAVSAAPRHAWESYFWRAKVRWRLRNPDAALADCSSALVIKEGSAEVLCWRALISVHSNKVKAAYLDFLRALLFDAEALKSFVMSRSEGEKTRLLAVLEDCAQRLFCHYMKSGTKLKCILLLCHLLVHLESTSSLYHSNLADALIVNGDYHRAAEELNEAERYCPENVSVLSRSSLVNMILGNANLCVLKLIHIAHLNLKGLAFTFKFFNEEQKRILVSESVAQAHLPSCDDNRALLFYTIAVFASHGQNPHILRVRSQCLGRLRCYEPAIGDLSAVITIGPRRVEDLCARANLHLLNKNSKAACGDFIAAMEMNEVVAKGFVSRCPADKDVVCPEFVKAARKEILDRNLAGALKICSFGLKIDPMHDELARLKRQLEYSARKCIIQ